MFKKLLVGALILSVVALFGASYVIRVATVAGPAQPQVKAAEKFKEIVETLSNGDIKVEIYHSGQLGDQRTQLTGVMRGEIQIVLDTGPSWFVDLGVPEFGVFNAAYVFRDLDHMYRVMNSPLVQKLYDKLLKKTGLRVLDTWYLGTRELDLTKKACPVYKPEDLKGVKLRMPNSKAWLDVGRALGANPTPMDFTEVYLGLKTGVIDGQDNPLPTDYAQKFYEVTHCIVLTDHLISILQPVINEKFWEKLPDKYKYYVKRGMEVARYYMNYLVLEQEAKLINFFKQQGMEIIVPNKEAFMEHAKEFYSKPEFDKLWGEGMYEKIQNY